MQHQRGTSDEGSEGSHPAAESARRPQPARRSARAGERQADRVHGRGFSYDCRIGFHEYERHIRQRVSVDFEAETDWQESARRDRARDLVDYYEINKAIQALVDGREWRLIEAMAEDIARLICTRFPVSRVRVRVDKLPFDMPNVGGVSVECWRTAADFAELTEDDLALLRGDRPGADDPPA